MNDKNGARLKNLALFFYISLVFIDKKEYNNIANANATNLTLDAVGYTEMHGIQYAPNGARRDST